LAIGCGAGGSVVGVPAGEIVHHQKVNEAPPAALSAEPEALYTGRLEGKVHPTSGRATIYKSSEGKQYLRLSDFTTSNGPDAHVLLVRAEDKALGQEIVEGESRWRGACSLKGNEGDQNYDLPATADLNQYQAVAIYCERFHSIFWRGETGEVLKRKCGPQ